ncbi:MAG: SUMF1/EgtB/PvdO family nonheme iron enzyme, partial [Bacteroidales bacterium]
LILAGWGLADETDGGDIANAWYYRGMGKPYAGKIPLSYTVNYNNIENTADSNYPNGYKAFYIMKHELSQHAYVDFLNTLSESQQEYLVNTGKPSATNASSNPRTFDVSRNWIRLREKAAGSPAIYGCWVDGETQTPWAQESNAGNVAVNGLDWYANTAYLCWAGLRPLTELEYEKACRGTAPIVENEYAWGTSSTIPVTGVPSNINKSNELANPTNANYIPQAANFPLRVGALATASSTRTDAGASFYGVLNLSDNVSEIYINICTPQGRAYSGEHGSGVLNGNGEAEIEKWPNNNSAVGTGIRGIYSNAHADVANRTYIETKISRSNPATFGMNSYVGCRGGRTAPK